MQRILFNEPIAIRIRSAWSQPNKPLEAGEYMLLMAQKERIYGVLDIFRRPVTAKYQVMEPNGEWRTIEEGGKLLLFAETFSYHGDPNE